MKTMSLLAAGLALISFTAVADPPQPVNLIWNANVFKADPYISAFATSLGIDPGNTALATFQGADGLEAVVMIKAWGGLTQNGNPTLLFVRGNGTSAAPQAVVQGNILGALLAQGYESASVFGGSPGIGGIEISASEDWSPSHTGSTILFYTQHDGTAYPTAPTLDAGLEKGVFSVLDHYRAQGVHGVNCAGLPTASYQVVGGIVTQC